jgi:hypothetical protein
MKAVVREPLLTRVSAFLADPQIRHVVGQRRSTVSFGKALSTSSWVVVNLSKGRLGSENSAVLGSLLFATLELEVLARARQPESERPLFAVYADELQNLVGHSFATLIAEARKYAVAITAGHQFWHQLSPEMRSAMLSVGSRVFFRVSYHDAQELAGELSPRERQYYAERLTTLPRGQAVFRTGSELPVEFAVQTHQTPASSSADIERLRQRSRDLYATPRSVIHDTIEERFYDRSHATVAKQLQERRAEEPDPSTSALGQ